MTPPLRFRRYRNKADLCERAARQAGGAPQSRLWRSLRDSYDDLADAMARHAHRRWREDEA